MKFLNPEKSLSNLKKSRLSFSEISIFYTPLVSVHSTLQRSFSLQLEVMFCLLSPHTSHPSTSLPWQESRTAARVCNTVRGTFRTLCVHVSARRGGGLAKEVRDVSTQNKDILLYSATYCTSSRNALWLCPLDEPSFGRQVFKESDSPSFF